jgi:hypothetical protein
MASVGSISLLLFLTVSEPVVHLVLVNDATRNGDL